MFAYYEDNQLELERLAETLTGTTRERLGRLFHAKLESIRPQRALLAAIVPHLVNPGDPLSAFSGQTLAVRRRAVAVFERALEGSDVPPGSIALVAHALWLLQLACMLVFIGDDSEGQRRTHGLVDDGLDLVVPLLPLLATPMGQALLGRVTTALERAELRLGA